MRNNLDNFSVLGKSLGMPRVMFWRMFFGVVVENALQMLPEIPKNTRKCFQRYQRMLLFDHFL